MRAFQSARAAGLRSWDPTIPRRSTGALRRPEREKSVRRRSFSGLCSLSVLALLVSWNPTTTNCRGGLLRSPIDHYELVIFESHIVGYIGSGADQQPIYVRSALRTSIATSVNIDPPVGGVVGWDNMWSGTWAMQNPPIVAVSFAGNRSGQPCP
jgi:hypothetical protein